MTIGSYLDKPSPPNGPLDVNDVHADHCTIDWKPPDDDGGIPIENYVIEKLDTATGRWVPATKVPGNQTSAVVDGLIPGHEYKVGCVEKTAYCRILELHHEVQMFFALT